MTDAIAVTPVRDKAGRKAFLDLPFSLYAKDPNWVAPLYLERLEHLDPKKNPYFRHAEAELFMAKRGGRAVGRISAQACRLRSARYNDGVGQFGFLEAIDDPAVFQALFETAGAWLRSRGMSRIQGPFSFSINDETGLLVDGFDRPPNMMMGHALPYYGRRVEEQGFARAKDLYAYEFDRPGEMPRALELAYAKATNSPHIRIRPLDKKNLMQELEIIVAISNDAWSENWGFVPWTQEEMTALGKNLKLLVTGDYIAIAEYKGEPVAMAVSLPNINDWIAGLNGRLLPFGWVKLASSLMRPPRSVRIPLMGLRKAYHGTALGSLLVAAVLGHLGKYHKARGATSAEMSWILEDNVPMIRLAEAFGRKPYKTYRVYERAI